MVLSTKCLNRLYGLSVFLTGGDVVYMVKQRSKIEIYIIPQKDTMCLLYEHGKVVTKK